MASVRGSVRVAWPKQARLGGLFMCASLSSTTGLVMCWCSSMASVQAAVTDLSAVTSKTSVWCHTDFWMSGLWTSGVDVDSAVLVVSVGCPRKVIAGFVNTRGGFSLLLAVEGVLLRRS